MNVELLGLERINSILKETYSEDTDITFTEGNANMLYINFGRNIIYKKNLMKVLEYLINRKPILVHWIGSDIYYFIKNKNKLKIKLKVMLLKILTRIANVKHLAAANHIKNELMMIGLKSEYCVMPTSLLKINHSTTYPLPNKFRVLTYLPENNHSFYRSDVILECAKNNPHIEFDIVGNNGESFKKLNNVFFHGWVSTSQMEELYKNVNCVVRIPIHDALGGTLLEGVLRGRYGVWSYKSDYAFHADNLKSLQEALEEIKKKKEPNDNGIKLLKEHFDYNKLSLSLKQIIISAGCGK